jgi:hypothetical protein
VFRAVCVSLPGPCLPVDDPVSSCPFCKQGTFRMGKTQTKAVTACLRGLKGVLGGGGLAGRGRCSATTQGLHLHSKPLLIDFHIQRLSTVDHC